MLVVRLIVRLLLCATFCYEGWTKVNKEDFQLRFFQRELHYSPEFLVFVGCCEMVIALMMIVMPLTAVHCMHFTMGASMYSHLTR